MEPNQATVQTKQVSFRRVYWSFPRVNCPRCGRDAPRVWDATRVAIDIDLDHVSERVVVPFAARLAHLDAVVKRVVVNNNGRASATQS